MWGFPLRLIDSGWIINSEVDLCLELFAWGDRMDGTEMDIPSVGLGENYMKTYENPLFGSKRDRSSLSIGHGWLYVMWERYTQRVFRGRVFGHYRELVGGEKLPATLHGTSLEEFLTQFGNWRNACRRRQLMNGICLNLWVGNTAADWCLGVTLYMVVYFRWLVTQKEWWFAQQGPSQEMEMKYSKQLAAWAMRIPMEQSAKAEGAAESLGLSSHGFVSKLCRVYVSQPGRWDWPFKHVKRCRM